MNLTCDNAEEKSLLIKAVKKVLKVDKIRKEDLERICRKIEVKYNLPFNVFYDKRHNLYLLSIEVSRGTYTTANCKTKTEALCKYIVQAKYQIKLRKVRL